MPTSLPTCPSTLISSNDDDQDTSPSLPSPPPLSQALPPAQVDRASASSASVDEWIDRIVTQSASTAPNTSPLPHCSTQPLAYSSTPPLPHSSTLTPSKRQHPRSEDCTALIESDTLLPLKRRNLERHLAAMAPPNQTPTRSSAGTLPSTQATPNDNRSLPKGSAFVKACMEGHNIYQEHPVFNDDAYKDFKELVSAPFESDRHSAVKASSVQRYQNVYNYYKDLNEASFKHQILSLIAKDEFSILIEPGTETSQAVYGPSDSWNKGLRVQYNQSVNRGHIPHSFTNPEFDKRKVNDALQKEGMLNAEPDAVWGFDPDNMPQNSLLPTTRELLFLLPKLSWPFFVIQSKQANGNFEEACNQAARDGIAIVSTARELAAKAGIQIDELGPDQYTYVYSAVMDIKIMEWYVHWAEVVKGGEVRYHMNTIVENRLLKGSNALSELRGPTHNILDWGLTKRKPMVEGWYDAISKTDMQSLLKKSALPSTSSSGAAAGSKRPRMDDDSGPADQGTDDGAGPGGKKRDDGAGPVVK